MDKLVRDKIPDIIAADVGKYPDVSVHQEDKRQYWLLEKLDEEIMEFEADPGIEELADIMEVVMALAYTVDHTPAELDIVRGAKFITRGGFFEGYILHPPQAPRPLPHKDPKVDRVKHELNRHNDLSRKIR